MKRANSAIALAIAATVAVASGAAQAAPPSEFEAAVMFVEQNATDGDTEVVVAGTAGDDGLKLLQIKWPDGQVKTTLRADASSLGMREFSFE